MGPDFKMNIELTIEKIAFGGDGLGFVDGKAYFVEGALPGERVLARIKNDKKNYGKARLLRILLPSPERVEPPCPYVRACGGCQYQHLRYEEELRWKELQVRESFAKELRADAPFIQPIRRGPKEYGYRQSITLHRTVKTNQKPHPLAFIGRDNHSFVFIENCMLADENLKSVFAAPHALGKYEIKRVFKIGQDKGIVSSEEDRLYRVPLGGEVFWAHSRGFFQNNLDVTELVAEEVAEIVRETAPSRFIDLYSGVGTFTVLSAPKIPELCCFEQSPYAIDCLRRNLNERGLPGAIFRGKVEQMFPNFWLGNRKEDSFILLDPPRLGITPQLAEFFSKADMITNLVYLACDLQILLRDLRIILSKGNYRIRTVVPFDMFPRTKHLEVLAWLERA
ncbi:MAG: 23S rRNA (uracil-C(5))-methyltransferase RlmCD [Candidatus Omnitrophica bacterium ADurb.Bin314]|jgi:tRNA/tmRNA/rRNA uracil-C5-methylase (TrmA/RlmC/RlmD family)|nr:MAG: 23S rRNA (uracil-C(5))-methyltransferase RlmCD [Candidatus Omnitrophica bacterium ADurb.Bin314]